MLALIDENDRILSKVIGQGHPTKNEIWRACHQRMEPNSHVTTDSNAAYVETCKQLECSALQIPSGKRTIDGYSLGVANNDHKRVKDMDAEILEAFQQSTWMGIWRGSGS